MKRVSIFLAAFLMYTITACADNDRITTNTDELPASSREFLSRYFATASISHIKIEKNLLRTDSYEVILTDGSHVEFNRKGEWKEVKVHQSAIPAGIIPAPIRTYVTQHYPGMDITAIDKDSRDYEVDLKNGIELKFDLQGRLIGID